ncbi:hypothetical protein [Candidatus Clostridium stratigraminis]|uniref:Uncharacterized protein n=1 Tax=Candidatus Clostridium stratigraminis TaxID=3381661 RepID=A0ABW8T065_9CLOT
MKSRTIQGTQSYTTVGGVCMVDSNNIERKENNVVQEFKLGNTSIEICDDFCYNRTSDEVDAILARIAGRAQHQLTAQD